MLGRDGSAGGSEVLVEVALVVVVMLGKFDVLDGGVVVLAMRASAFVIEAPASMCTGYLRHQLSPTVLEARLCSSWARSWSMR